MNFDRFNIVDIIILLIILASIWNFVRQGFILSIARLAAGFVALLAALFFNEQATDLLVAKFELPRTGAAIVAFLIVWIIAQFIFNLIVQFMIPLQRQIRSTPLFGQLDILLSASLGGISGFFTALFLILPFVITPLVPQITALVQESAIGSKMALLSRSALMAIDPLVGEALQSGLISLAPPQNEQAYTDLGFRVTEGLQVDEVAEARMLELVNQERVKVGLPVLVMDPSLRDLARAHSREMFELGYFSHDSPVSGSPVDRMNRANIPFLAMGENLAYAPTVQIAHEGLMRSPGHRANILSANFGKIGIGVISSPTHGEMFTQEFHN